MKIRETNMDSEYNFINKNRLRIHRNSSTETVVTLPFPELHSLTSSKEISLKSSTMRRTSTHNDLDKTANEASLAQ